MSISQSAGTELLIIPAVPREPGNVSATTAHNVFLDNTKGSKVSNSKPVPTDLWTPPA